MEKGYPDREPINRVIYSNRETPWPNGFGFLLGGRCRGGLCSAQCLRRPMNMTCQLLMNLCAWPMGFRGPLSWPYSGIKLHCAIRAPSTLPNSFLSFAFAAALRSAALAAGQVFNRGLAPYRGGLVLCGLGDAAPWAFGWLLRVFALALGYLVLESWPPWSEKFRRAHQHPDLLTRQQWPRRRTARSLSGTEQVARWVQSVPRHERATVQPKLTGPARLLAMSSLTRMRMMEQ